MAARQAWRAFRSACRPGSFGTGSGKAPFSSLPDDIRNSAKQSRFPARRGSGEGTADSYAPKPTQTPGSSSGASGISQKEAAQLVTAWMLPWERRQMEGGKLHWWEKAYWVAFAGCLGLLAYNHLPGYFAKEAPKVDEEKEARKREAARMVLAGHSLLDSEDDPFDGLSPEDIAAYVVEATQGASAADPFEGMSPEEINEYLEAQQRGTRR